MIAWSHLSQAQCYFQKELGGVPSSDIYEHHMQYKDILMDVVRAIHSEAKSRIRASTLTQNRNLHSRHMMRGRLYYIICITNYLQTN